MPASPLTARFCPMKRPYAFASPFGGREFALLLVVGDDDILPEEQTSLSEEFVHQGCRYAVCAGVDCSSWDDSIDMVSVLDEVEGRSRPLVMTTWHDDEPIEEVVEFFARNANWGDRQNDRYLVVILGGSAGLEAAVRAAVDVQFESCQHVTGMSSARP